MDKAYIKLWHCHRGMNAVDVRGQTADGTRAADCTAVTNHA
jgi:hypothetical protein